MGFIATIIIGLIAGCITGKIMHGGGYGIWRDIILGIIGSIVGGWLTAILVGANLVTGFNLTSLIVAVIGSVVVVVIYRLITRRSVTS
ncbi:MAG: GlsB/YeaQ/YmgE family stress response membrane protein [Thermomicrobiales bacterium]